LAFGWLPERMPGGLPDGVAGRLAWRSGLLLPTFDGMTLVAPAPGAPPAGNGNGAGKLARASASAK